MASYFKCYLIIHKHWNYRSCSASIVKTNTPIKHLVIIFQENVSFDHYFATYHNATNPSGEPKFTSSPATPSVNGLSSNLLVNNPNGNYSVYPFRLDRSQAMTCDMDHEYPAEQQAYHGGLLDKFVEFASSTYSGCTPTQPHKKQVMGYFDGNTVTALWNYAQHFAMSDNSFGTTFGPLYSWSFKPCIWSDSRRNSGKHS